ncbi:MAG: PAS domain-containing protein [Gammaproteobacteria bacterium]|nr:PAS domain-containing protein [Gammaproteobacteria bacterium]
MNLTTRITATILTALAGLSTAFAWVAIQNEKATLEALLQKEGRAIAHIIAVFSVETLLTEDYPVLESVLRTIGARTPEVLAMEVMHNGRRVASYDGGLEESSHTLNRDIVFADTDGSAGYRLGEVRLLLSDEENRAIIRSRMGDVATMFLTVFVVLGLVLYVILRQVVLSRISALTVHAERISTQGIDISELAIQGATSGRDELDRLYNRFSTMLTRIQKREQELDRTRALLTNVIDSMPSIMVTVDPMMHITYWNQGAQQMTGLGAENARGRQVHEVLSLVEPRIDDIQHAIENGKVHEAPKFKGEVEGKQCIFLLTAYPLITDGVQGAVIRIDDVTERVRMEEIMMQTEKMMSVGGLAAGMAHEINNPLGVMVQSAQNVMRRVSLDFPANIRDAEACNTSLESVRCYLEKRQVLKFLEDIRTDGARAATIVKNMLQFSRRSESEFESASLSLLIERTISLAGNDYDLKKHFDFRRIEIARDYQKGLQNIPLVVTEIEQVMLNLLKNGAQAMAEKKAEMPNYQPAFVLRTHAETDYLRIEVEDNGPGMQEDTRRRLFEPFFTTKPPGSGTGLGLSVSYMIVTNNHQGTMNVESQPGDWTRFIIRLPIKRGEN